MKIIDKVSLPYVKFKHVREKNFSLYKRCKYYYKFGFKDGAYLLFIDLLLRYMPLSLKILIYNDFQSNGYFHYYCCNKFTNKLIFDLQRRELS